MKTLSQKKIEKILNEVVADALLLGEPWFDEEYVLSELHDNGIIDRDLFDERGEEKIVDMFNDFFAEAYKIQKEIQYEERQLERDYESSVLSY